MEMVTEFLLKNASTLMYVIMLLSLGLGYLVGKCKIGKFTFGATLGTLIVAIAANLLLRQIGLELGAGELQLPGMLKNFAFALFSFTLGYEAGPTFVRSMRTTGVSKTLKPVLLAGIYCVVVYGVTQLFRVLFRLDNMPQLIGLLAGAQTQSTILDGAVGGDAVAYAITYVFGTVGMIMFGMRIAPAMLHVKLDEAVSTYVKDNGGNDVAGAGVTATKIIQMRAYYVKEGASCANKTVVEVENGGYHHMEVQAIHRLTDGKMKPIDDMDQNTVILPGDVLTVVGSVASMKEIDQELEESMDDSFLNVKLVHAGVVVTRNEEKAMKLLTHKGILLESVQRGRKSLTPDQAGLICRHDIIHVTGADKSVNKLADELGYVKDHGGETDVPFILIVIAIAAVIGAVKIGGIGLGAGCCAMLLGIAAGIYHDRHPLHGYYQGSAAWLMRSLGLNLFIAITALNSKLDPSVVFSLGSAKVFAVGLLLTLIPPILCLLIGKYVLRMGAVDLIGGLCGSATCTASLNAVEESTEKNGVFTVAYTPAYVVSNILLTIMGRLI